MQTDRVVVPSPGFDQHLGFGEAVEDLAVEQFVTQRELSPNLGDGLKDQAAA